MVKWGNVWGNIWGNGVTFHMVKWGNVFVKYSIS